MGNLKGRILCVDNGEDTREMKTALPGLEGYEIVTAQTVADGLALAVANNFDLILLDWVFPDGTGIELCKNIRASGTHTSILFYSGMALKDEIENAMSAGAQGFLVKPVDFEEPSRDVSRYVRNDRSVTFANRSLGQ